MSQDYHWRICYRGEKITREEKLKTNGDLTKVSYRYHFHDVVASSKNKAVQKFREEFGKIPISYVQRLNRSL